MILILLFGSNQSIDAVNDIISGLTIRRCFQRFGGSFCTLKMRKKRDNFSFPLRISSQKLCVNFLCPFDAERILG